MIPSSITLSVCLLLHAGPAADAGPPEDPFTRAVLTALDMHRRGDETRALRALWDAVDDARSRAPLSVHTGLVLDDYPENLGIQTS